MEVSCTIDRRRRKTLSARGMKEFMRPFFLAYLERVYGCGPDAIRLIAKDFDKSERAVRDWFKPDGGSLPGLESMAACAGAERIERFFDGDS